MRRQRRTADDFVRDMKAKQQNKTPGEVERKTSEGLIPEQASAWRGKFNHTIGFELTPSRQPRAAGHSR